MHCYCDCGSQLNYGFSKQAILTNQQSLDVWIIDWLTEWLGLKFIPLFLTHENCYLGLQPQILQSQTTSRVNTMLANFQQFRVNS